MGRSWTEQETRWLEVNVDRMDAQSLSRALGIPLADVEDEVGRIKARAAEAMLGRKSPATVRDLVKERSAARREYEKAMELLRRKDTKTAAARFSDLIEKYPEEKELVDRARVYLAAARNGKNRPLAPEDPSELYHQAVFEKNRGNVGKALELLARAAEGPDGDGRVQYLAACCHALEGRMEDALESLRHAVRVSPQNRIQARLEADLAPLRGTHAFAQLLAGA